MSKNVKDKSNKMNIPKELIVAGLMLIVLLVVAVGIGREASRGLTNTVENLEISKYVREIESINDIEDKKTRTKLVNAVNEGKDVLYTDTGVDYVIIDIESTDKDIEISDVQLSEERNNIDVYWRLVDKANGDTTDMGKEIAVYEIKNPDKRTVSINVKPSIIDDSIKNIISVRKGEKHKLVDVDTNKVVDVTLVSWYGDGIYNVVLDGSNIQKAQKLKVLETKGKVIEAKNTDGKAVIDIGDGVRIEATNLGEQLLVDMIYKFQVYYEGQTFKVYPVEYLIKPRA